MGITKTISKEAFELILKMTERDQFKRPTADECLHHPWFFMNLSEKPLKDAMENLKSFNPNIDNRLDPEFELINQNTKSLSSALLFPRFSLSNTLKTSISKLNKQY